MEEEKEKKREEWREEEGKTREGNEKTEKFVGREENNSSNGRR